LLNLCKQILNIMNMFKNILTLILISVLTFNCKNETKPEVKTVEVNTESIKTVDENAIYAKAEFTIEGMTCAMGCAKTIEKKIAGMDGVKSANVDFDKKLAMVEYNQAKVTPALLEETVTKVGDVYKVSNMKSLCNKPCCDGKTDKEKAACKMTASAEMKKECAKEGSGMSCCAGKTKV
jgi:periplasmic mercuric ion binding protein